MDGVPRAGGVGDAVTAATRHPFDAFHVTLDPGRVASADTPLLAVILGAGAELPESLAELDRAAGAAITTAISSRDFRGARDEVLLLTGTASVRRIALVGAGRGTVSLHALRRGAAIAARTAVRLGTGRLTLYAGDAEPDGIEAAVVGMHAGAWQWTETRTPPPPDERKAPLAAASILVQDTGDNRAAVGRGNAMGAGYTLARNLGMSPGNVCTPEYLARVARDIAERHAMTLTELDRAGLEREGMGAFLAVASGTPQEPRMVVLEYRRGPAGGAPVVLVGKGLCFDSGGISIKPAPGMEWMKFDMSGAGAVLGAMEAVARLALPINVVGVIGATTNMPSGTAMNPGDVVRSQLGKYIEIVNTDAEGRLVLADLLSYVRRFRPSAVIDAATLTGACVIALGHVATGVLGSEQPLVDEVLAACDRAGERGWQLPLWDDYGEQIKSDVADIKNSGGRAAGTITAAMFLKEFAGDYPWAHLDIAGTAYSETDLGYIPKGPTGAPVGTFVEFLRGRV